MKTDGPVAEVMTPHPRSVQVDQQISDVRKALEDGRVHHLPVVDGKRVVGIISTTDLLELGFKPRDSHEDLDAYLDGQFKIRDVMHTDVITIPSGSTVRDAARVLRTGIFHAVPVVDEARNLLGIVTSTDIVSYVASQD
jgi:CBS domain-containing protein